MLQRGFWSPGIELPPPNTHTEFIGSGIHLCIMWLYLETELLNLSLKGEALTQYDKFLSKRGNGIRGNIFTHRTIWEHWHLFICKVWKVALGHIELPAFRAVRSKICFRLPVHFAWLLLKTYPSRKIIISSFFVIILIVSVSVFMCLCVYVYRRTNGGIERWTGMHSLPGLISIGFVERSWYDRIHFHDLYVPH